MDYPERITSSPGLQVLQRPEPDKLPAGSRLIVTFYGGVLAVGVTAEAPFADDWDPRRFKVRLVGHPYPVYLRDCYLFPEAARAHG